MDRDSGYATASAFRSQPLWQKAQDFAEEIAALVVALHRDAASNAIGSQLIRSAGSIGANVAEGYGRFSQAAYRNHLSIARGSTFECESWLDLLMRRGYVTQERGELLIAHCQEIGRMLTSRMKLLNDGKTYAIRDEEARYGADA